MPVPDIDKAINDGIARIRELEALLIEEQEMRADYGARERSEPAVVLLA